MINAYLMTEKTSQASRDPYDLVDTFVNISERGPGICIPVQWLGLLDRCDWTWQRIE